MSTEVRQTAGSEAPAGAGAVTQEKTEHFWKSRLCKYYERMGSTLIFWMQHYYINFEDGMGTLWPMFREDCPELAEMLAQWWPSADAEA